MEKKKPTWLFFVLLVLLYRFVQIAETSAGQTVQLHDMHN